ncbi:hypothetical protein [Terriglobus sp.]|uniref:hypothetical protein n=1 Tax=Terriglobus sp. TaxID=1889013 RepID=UPI003AFFE5A8
MPISLGVSGCGGSSGTSAGNLCPGFNPGGTIIGQPVTVLLQPYTTGLSLNTGQNTSLSTPTATDCTGANVSLTNVHYSVDTASANAHLLDINPITGNICAGTWNRNSAGGVPDYSTCMPTGASGVGKVTATAGAAGSNAVQVYVHPVITNIEIGAASTDCVNDPASNCSQYGAGLPGVSATATYNPNDCLSFGQSSQLVTRFYKGPKSTTLPDPNNVTYAAGLPSFTLQTAQIGTFDANNRGIFLANAPGSSVVTASLGSGAGSITSNAGFVSVCAPQSITINTPNAVNGNVTVNVSNTENITATVLDTKNVQITGLNLTFISTSPISTPVSAGGIVPTFAGGSNITALCLPPTCNPAPLAQIGRYPNGAQSGNGKPVSSNPIVVNTPGVTSSLIWAASTDSLYLLPIDLTAGSVPAPTKLPYQPNSLVLTQAGDFIYLGSSTGLMTYSTAINSVTSINQTVQGTAIAVSPTGTELIVSDPARQLIYIYSPSAGAITTSFGGVASRGAWTQDGTTAYIVTTDGHLLVYNTNTSWHSYDLSRLGSLNDVITAVPVVGAFIGAQTAVDGRSYCPNTTTAVTDFYPEASNTVVSAAVADRLAATNDGKHVLDARLATANGTPVLNDLLLGNGTGLPTGACPASGAQPAFTTTVNTAALTGVQAGTVTGVYPASDSSIAFVTNTAATGDTNTGALLAAYRPAANGAGTVSTVKLANGATAAVTGALSSDNRFFFAGTSGDNLIHFITVSSLTDTRQINPNLPLAANPNLTATPNLIASRPRTSLNGQ